MNEETIVEAKGLVKRFAPKGAPPVTAKGLKSSIAISFGRPHW